MKLPSSKEALILTAALVLPGGFVVLGLWKAYELYRKKNEDDTVRQKAKLPADSQSVGFISYVDSKSDRLSTGELES